MSASGTSGRVCLGPRRAARIFSKASWLAGAGRALRGQPSRHGGSEGSSGEARLHQRICRTSQGLGIGAAGDRPRRLARIQSCVRKDELNTRWTYMSALGHKRTFAAQKGMSALPPKADISGDARDVRFVPIADIDELIRSPRRRGLITSAAR